MSTGQYCSRWWAQSATACTSLSRLASQCRPPGMSDQSPKGSWHAFNLCECGHVHSCHSRGTHPPLLRAPGRRDKLEKKKRYEEENERLRDGREGGRRKSTADSCNPRSLSQLGMIVMESLRQKPEEKTLHWQALLCQPLKRPLYTIHQPLCLWDVDKREIWPRYISVPSMMQLKEGQTWGPSCRNPPFLLKKPRSCTFSSFAQTLYIYYSGRFLELTGSSEEMQVMLV